MHRAPAAPANSPDAPALGEAARPVVWVVDADPTYAEQARHHLARDHDVEVLHDGPALLARLALGSGPEALLLATRLPGMGGLEVLRALRPGWDRLRLPVLMVTSQARRQDVVAGFRAGANDYLIKPYDPYEMLARVDALVGVRRLGERRLRDRLDEAEAHARGAAEALSRSQDEWVARVGHELRSPLNAMLGWTRMLRSGQLPPERRERALETIERNAVTQTRLIEGLLDASSGVSGRLQPASSGAGGEAPPTPDTAHPPALRGLRVLVVDDEPDAREVVVGLLAQCGAAVTSAASAREARELIARDAPEVLVSDIGMPGETGYDLIRGLRAGDGAAARLPAVALTAYARPEDRARALAAGFDAHLAKPVEPAELARVIARLAGRT